MTPENKRRVFRYGIAIDLVILASGVGLLIPTAPVALTVIYVAAVALAAWKGGWEGAWTSIILSAWLLPLLFEIFTFSHLFGFVAASIAAAAIVRSRFITRIPRPAFAGRPLRRNVVSFENVQGDFEQTAPERKVVATTLERTASQQLEAVRIAAIENAREEREAEERARVEAEEESRRAVEEAVQRAAAETLAAEADAQRQIDEERRRVEEAEQQRLATEADAQRRIEEERRRAAEEEQQRLVAAEEARRVSEEQARGSEDEARRALEDERRRIESEARQLADEERRLAGERAQELLETERRAAEAELQQRLAAEREAIRVRLEEQLAEERQALEKEAAEKLAAARAAAKPAGPGIVETVTSTVTRTVSGWFQRVKPRGVNLSKKTTAAPASRRPIMAPPRPAAVRRPPSTVTRQPRLLMLERRRGTADTVVAKLRQQGVEIAIVERLVDAVDELFRFRPDVVLIDTELSDFDKSYKTIADQNPNLPIALTGRSGGSGPVGVRSVGYFGRPFDANALAALATKAMAQPAELTATPASRPVPVVERAPRPAAEIVAPPPRPAAPKEIAVVKSVSENEYEVVCYNCRSGFDALDADWCSCLTKERTLVCTNCLTCFCKAPPAYKEKFWLTAPPRLFERKNGESRRQGSLPANSEPEGITRPLVLTVEDDEDIQAIIARVCKNLGYGFIYAMNGLDGLALARQYRPNLILSDAFMPKLDGREMCRILREESPGADWRMVVMTGLYTDTKYRSEAVKRFHIDDYIAKPVAITELINLLQKHLDGVSGLPVQDVDLHELHRQDYEDETEGIALADLLVEEERREAAGMADTSEPALRIAKPRPKPSGDDYEICCFNCSQMFDATRAEWCTCVGRDQTLVCPSCTGCFCKAPPAYKERFWMDAPPSLFERKMIGSKRHLSARSNPTRDDVKRPLILLVEDDENVQLIVKTVVTSMGYGFIAGANGQEGLALAREYDPDLILSDAFMPKLDGREMCRLLKEDPATARARAIIMTGLYTDRKYRNEALDYFKVDDYVAKPLAVDDLIKLFKKHLPHEVQATM